jgi:hypothetical protein
MLSSSESNITQIKLNGVTYTDSNISWITVPNSNEYGYDIIYKGSINLDVSALKSGTNTLSNLTGASNLSDWAIAVVYKDTSFNYLNVINTREYLRIFDINDTPSSPQDAVVSMFDSSMDFLGFQTPSELNETGSKIATLNISESSNTLFTPQIEGNDKSVPYLGEESVSNEVGVDKKSALIRFSNEQKRYYSSFLGLITKVKSPLCYYAHNNKGSKNNQKSYDIALGDRVLITFDTDIDTSNFSGSENATNTFVSLETSSNFKFDFIGNSGLLAEDGDVKTISIGSVVNQGNGDAFRYRLTLISEPSGVIDSVLPQSVKASFDFGSFGRFENITIKECQNDKFVYQDIERIFDIFGEFNGFGSNGDVDGDSNITTQSLDDNKTLTLSPLNLETFDNNRSYKLTITLVDIQNGGATIKTVPLPNSGIFDSEHNTTEFDIASLDLDSVYRHLAFNIEWVLVDENGVEIDVLDSNGSSTKVSGTTQSDGFSIKPDRFDITVPEGARAGENFTIKIKSLNKDGSDAKNYNEIENTSFTFKTIKNINSLGSIEYKSPIRFTDGNTSDFDMNISEVGSFDINISDGGDSITPSDCSFCNEATINASCLDVSGCPFACVDIKSDSCEGLSLITSDAEDINITPYSFEITNFKISDDWAYMGGYDSGNKVEINATIIAKNFQGATTQNFTSEIFNDINMSLITLNADFNITLNNPSGNSFDLNTSVGTTPNISELAGLFSILTSSTDFINGEQNISLAMNIDRNHFNRLNPIEFLVNDINTTNSGAVIPAENIGIVVNDRFGLYYGRVYAPNIEIDVNDTPFKNAIFTEVYMQDTAYDFDNLISNRIENAQNVNWYQNELDSITIIDEVRAINLSGNLDSFIDLIVDENQVINTLSIVDGNYTISSIGIDSLEISSISHIPRFFIKADKHLWFDIASTSDYDGDSNNINRQSYFEVAFRKGDDGPGVNEGIKPNTLNKRRLDW